MKISAALNVIKENVLDLLFPIYCCVCGKDGVFLCDSCAPRLERLETQKCVRCEHPSPFGKTHPDCMSKNYLDGCVSVLNYKAKVNKKLIELYKYKFINDLSLNLSLLMHDEIKNQALSDYFSDFEVVPVPLHKKRLNWRGFNQSLLLAENLCGLGNLKLNSGLVLRNKYTQPQIDLSAADRKKNVANAFVLNHAPINRKYLLVDDVVTTGSTLNEMARLLKHEGAAEVWAITLARG